MKFAQLQVEWDTGEASGVVVSPLASHQGQLSAAQSVQFEVGGPIESSRRHSCLVESLEEPPSNFAGTPRRVEAVFVDTKSCSGRTVRGTPVGYRT